MGINCYLYGIIFISGEMTSILQSQLVYGTVPPQTHCPRWACAPGLVKNEHCIPSVRDSDTDAWPNWRPKDTVGLCRDTRENLECFGLNSLPGVLVLHKAWKGRSVEGWQQTRGQWHPDDLNCAPASTLLPRHLSYRQCISFFLVILSQVNWSLTI